MEEGIFIYFFFFVILVVILLFIFEGPLTLPSTFGIFIRSLVRINVRCKKKIQFNSFSFSIIFSVFFFIFFFIILKLKKNNLLTSTTHATCQH